MLEMIFVLCKLEVGGVTHTHTREHAHYYCILSACKKKIDLSFCLENKMKRSSELCQIIDAPSS